MDQTEAEDTNTGFRDDMVLSNNEQYRSHRQPPERVLKDHESRNIHDQLFDAKMLKELLEHDYYDDEVVEEAYRI